MTVLPADVDLAATLLLRFKKHPSEFEKKAIMLAEYQNLMLILGDYLPPVTKEKSNNFINLASLQSLTIKSSNLDNLELRVAVLHTHSCFAKTLFFGQPSALMAELCIPCENAIALVEVQAVTNVDFCKINKPIVDHSAHAAAFSGVYVRRNLRG